MVLKQLGVRFSSIQQLLFCPLIDTHGLIPYGFNRNHVLMEVRCIIGIVRENRNR